MTPMIVLLAMACTGPAAGYGDLRANATTAALTGGISDTDIAEHVTALKADLPDGFHVVAQSPFAVIGNESDARVRQRAERTVKWASEALQDAYFDEELDEIWDIWLFGDADSYQHYAWKLFGDRPDTPYGYASSEHNALIMNISTGGGTLVHEIVHPYMDHNFSEVPSWFNEGLASLYEASANDNGVIVGLPNWRLDGLQAAIAADAVPSFEALMSTSTHQFYNRDPGTHYAQARYLCHYLQDHGKLRQFYRAFAANHETDPTGIDTLKNVLGTRDLEAFKVEWQDWVMNLRR